MEINLKEEFLLVFPFIPRMTFRSALSAYGSMKNNEEEAGG